jgi:ATP-dependent exoDNAse (exonuclease V) beta subunit
LSLRNRVEQLWGRLGGPATLHNSTDLNDVRSYLDLLEDWQVASTVKDWDGFAQAADKLFAAPNAGEAERPSIQIMTIHKSKGLEFDHVLLPGLCRTPKSGDRQLLRWQQHMDQQGQQSLIMAPLGPHDEEDDSIYRYLKYEDTVKTELENTRVLYVAATRAVHKLYLFGQLKPSKIGWQSPGKTTLLGPIWKGVEADIAAGTYAVNQVAASNQVLAQQPGLRHKRRLVSNFSAAPAPVPHLSTGAEGNRKSEAETQGGSLISSRAKHLGTCIHRTLKQIANEGVPAWSAERLQRLPLTWSAQLKELGLLASEEELGEMSRAIGNMLTDPKGLWILHHHYQAACEQVLGYSSTVAGHGGVSIVDRTFVEGEVRWVIDYKFAAPESGEQTSDFVQGQIASYQAQLRHYANLYRNMAQLPVRCALYFPQIPLFVEVAAD